MNRTDTQKTREALLGHYHAYPGLQIQDVFKFLFHSAMGCEHLVTDERAALAYIQKEFATLPPDLPIQAEPLDGDYSRVHLGIMNDGLTAETFGKLFFMSAKHEVDGVSNLKKKLQITYELILSEKLPFSEIELTAAAKIWRGKGFPPLHHSEKFRSHYHPSYRLIANRFVPYLPLFCEIDKALGKGSVTLAIDGGAASGKTTLAQILQEVYGCSVIHVDDYFLRPEQRTLERLSEIGGNFDRERFTEEVILPLSRGEDVHVRPFDCSTGTVGDGVTVEKKPLTVIEGAYSMHPELCEHYTLSVFLDVSPELQRERIECRNSPEMACRFFSEWIPKERAYFDKFDIQKTCTLTVSVG